MYAREVEMIKGILRRGIENGPSRRSRSVDPSCQSGRGALRSRKRRKIYERERELFLERKQEERYDKEDKLSQ